MPIDSACLSETVLAIQSLGAWLVGPMRFFSILGNGALYVIIVCALYWNVDSRAGLRLGSLLFLSLALNSLAKLAFHVPRPYWCDPRVQALSAEVSFGFPSGHAENAATVWLALAWLIGRRWAWIAALLLTFLIGLSRLYLGVHSALDVSVGWLLGGLLVWAYWAGEKWAGVWWAEQSLSVKWRMITLWALVLLLLGIAARLSLGSWAVPDAWVVNAARANPAAPAIAPVRLSDLLPSVGAWWGLGIGAAWLAVRGFYSTQGTRQQRDLRYVVGVLGTLVLALGAYLLVPLFESWPLYIVQFVFAAVGGLWVSALAPLTFVRLGLAQRETVVL